MKRHGAVFIASSAAAGCFVRGFCRRCGGNETRERRKKSRPATRGHDACNDDQMRLSTPRAGIIAGQTTTKCMMCN